MNISELTKFRGGVSVDTINELTSASGVTADGVLLKDAAVTATGGVTAPTISEAVSGSGVTVDGVLLKDSNVNASGVTAATVTATGNVVTDTILERTSAAGVTIDGVLLKDGGITATGTNTINLTTITADTINETTAGSGVTVDGVLIKDSGIANTFIANDGSADSPRGYGSVTTAGPHSFAVSKTGPSLYNVSCNAASGAITATLPNDVKEGYRVRFEVTLTNSTEANSFFTSPSIAAAQINGTGFVELMALKDNPQVAGDWKVTDVDELCTTAPITGVTFTGGAPTTVSSSWFRLSRSKSLVVCSVGQVYTTPNATATTTVTTGNIIPTRFRHAQTRFLPVVAGMSQNINQIASQNSSNGLVGSTGNFEAYGFSLANMVVWEIQGSWNK
jgi:hypothetical protein